MQGASGVQVVPTDLSPREIGFVSEDSFRVLLPSLAAHIAASETPITGKMFHAIMHYIAVAISLGCSWLSTSKEGCGGGVDSAPDDASVPASVRDEAPVLCSGAPPV